MPNSYSIKILCFIGISCCISAKTYSHSITVAKNTPLCKIRNALDIAQPYDTIWVKSGTYTEENLQITKPLTLIGIGLPTLDGLLKDEIFSVKSSNVTIQGFRIINSGYSSMEDKAGIRVYGVNNIHILNNRLENTFFGIYLTNAVSCRIENNYLEAGKREEYYIGNGIHLWKCDSAIIKGNTAKHHRDGIYFEFVTNTKIENNYSEGNLRYGLHFMFSHQNDYENNVFHNNGAGVAVMYSHHVTMRHNRFEDNGGGAAYGLLLKDIRDSHIENNFFTRNTSGVYMEGCSRSHIRHNDFKENGYALRIMASCDDNTIEFNNFYGNTFDVATNGSLVLNKFNQNYWDKYEGYDLNRNGLGDVPYHPVSLYAMTLENVPSAVLLMRSFAVILLDRIEKVVPALTPENLKDNNPSIKPIVHDDKN
jgi:nitrous oxidase accessory protein